MNRGWQTSEFWVMVISNIIGIAVLAGALTQEEGEQLKNAIQQVVGAVISLSTIIAYIYSRTKIKQAQIATQAMIKQPKNK